MAERRMFAKTITNSDAFMEMPTSAQCLYFHLSMNADDDGFINKPRALMRMAGAKEDDLKILIAKSFILPFEDGVVVIKHWRINNYIQKDRYKSTKYIEDMKMLSVKENGSYTFIKLDSANDVYTLDTQNSIGKSSIDKNSIVKVSLDKERKDYQEKKTNQLTLKQQLDLIEIGDEEEVKGNYPKLSEVDMFIKLNELNNIAPMRAYLYLVDHETPNWQDFLRQQNDERTLI